VAGGSIVGKRGAGWLVITWPPALAAFLAAPAWLGPGIISDDPARLTIRLALLYYALALGLMLVLRRDDWEGATPRGRLTRWAWTLGWLTFLVHLAAAFHYYHHWSHTDARERTAEIGGFSGGIYFSYLFTLLWTADVAWWWLSPGSYAARRPLIDRALHSYMLFMVFNATVIYETGFIRWAGISGMAILGILAVVRLARQPQPRDI